MAFAALRAPRLESSCADAGTEADDQGQQASTPRLRRADGSHVTGRLGLRALGTVFAAPAGAWALTEAPVVRPLPGTPDGLRGVAMLDGRAAPAWALSHAPEHWIAVEHAGGIVLVGGERIVAPGPSSPALEIPSLAPRALPERAFSRPSSETAAAPRPDRHALVHGAGVALVALGNLETLLNLTGLAPMPGMPRGALCLADVDGRPALVLDPGWCTARPDAPPPGPLVAVFRSAGRRFAVPVEQARPGREGVDLERRLAETAEGRALLAAAPQAGTADGAADGLLPLLVCAAGEARFALPVSEVATVLAPRPPLPLPAAGAPALRGVVAHRGEVLPLIDIDPRLASPFAEAALAASPMIRLVLPRPVAVPVQRILGLQMMPRRAIRAVAGDAIIAAMVQFEGAGLPLCRAATLAAPVGTA